MSPFPTSKGHLNPGGAVRMTRIPASPEVAPLVRHYWIPEWNLAPGDVERQLVLGYPACNVVVERDVVTLAGPTTRASHRDLSGSGWAIGALLRPAAGPLVLGGLRTGEDGARHARSSSARLVDLVDREIVVDDRDPLPGGEGVPQPDGTAARSWGGLREQVGAAMARKSTGDAVAALQEWLLCLAPLLAADGLLANRLQEVVEAAPIRRVNELASRLAISPRSLQRLAATYVGLSPSAMIRRRRLQDAADEVRQDPGADLTSVALRHGYADHAHLTREFREVLGFTPSQYRGPGRQP